jgi:Phosphoglycerate dehydrogenase and related dehydrogenases
MNKQPNVLVVTDADDPQLAMLAGIPHYLVNSQAALEAMPDDAEVILHWAGPRALVRSAFLGSQHLRWVHSRSAGLDSMLFPELIESTIPLTNGTGVFSQSLGEFALAVILYFAKDIRRLLRNQEACRWEQFDVEELPGQTVGIVAYGDIGRAVASRVHAMGMRVLALKRHAPSTHDPLVNRFYAPDELHAMLAQCDYVVSAAPLTAETHHMIGDEAIAAMKSNAVVINIGRGPVIDQAALVRALAEGRIKGAGLDVFEQEPIPADDPIFKLPNILISPHSADHTKDWLNQAMRFFLEQYQRFSAGEPLHNIVQKHLGY